MSHTVTRTLDSYTPEALSALTGRDLGELSVIEVTARKLDRLKGSIDDRTEPLNPLSTRDIEVLSSKTTKEGVSAFFKGKIESAATQGEAIAFAKMYSNIESRVFTRIESEALPPTWMSDFPLTHFDVFEKPVGSEVKPVKMRNQLGLTGPSRGIEVKKEELQKRLDEGFRDLAVLIGTDHPFDAHISKGGAIHTIVVHRPILDPDGTPTGKHEKQYYDLTHEAGIKQLLSDNAGEAVTELPETFQERLSTVGQELDNVMNEVSPRTRSASGPRFSNGSVNNQNGENPFSRVGGRVGQTLMNQNYFRQSILPLFERHGLTNQDGMLNKQGIKAYKEVAAALQLRRGEAAVIGAKLKSKKTDLEQLKNDSSIDHTSADVVRKKEELQQAIQALSSRESELNEASQSEFAMTWMIVQLNAPVRVTIGDGPAVTTMSIREALELKEPRFTVHGNGFDGDTNGKNLTALTFRQKLAKDASIEFNQAVLKKSKGRFESASDSTGFFKKHFTQKNLEESELVGGFEMGTMFYYPGILDGEPDPTLRIQNQLRHERSSVGYRLCRDIPVGEWIKIARSVVEAEGTIPRDGTPEEVYAALPEEVKAHFDPKIFDPDSQEDQQFLQNLVQGTLKKVGLFSFAPDTTTAKDALNIMRDKKKGGLVYDSRHFWQK